MTPTDHAGGQPVVVPATSIRRLWIVLAALVVSQLCFKIWVERGEIRPFGDFPAIVFATLDAEPQALLAPIKIDQETERRRWTTTGLIPIVIVDRAIGRYATFLLLASVLVIVAFWCAWCATHSTAVAATLGLMTGFGTQFNYCYPNSSILAFYPLWIYLLVNLLAVVKLTTGCERPNRWRIVFLTSLLCTALCWEVWLDYAGFLLAGAAAVLIWRWRHGIRPRWQGLVWISSITIASLAAYLPVRMGAGGDEFVTAGMESETISTYPSLALMVEDFLSNCFTHTYIAVTNYLPSIFITSNSLMSLGEDRIVELQHGYHAEFQHLTAQHHVFFWHFYAGFVACALLLSMAWLARRCWRDARPGYLVLCVGGLMIACGFATHALIKFRPYMSAPVLSYKSTISILGVSLVGAYLVLLMRTRLRPKVSSALIALVWVTILVAAVTRPGMQARMLGRLNMPGPPDPLVTIQGWISGDGAAPTGGR